jgi:ABC transport system ATP-binding/permease protein
VETVDGGTGGTVDTSVYGDPVACFGDKHRLYIGRGGSDRNDIPLTNDLLVSERHAEIVRSHGKAEIVDLSGSRGLGVYVGGRRISRSDLPSKSRFSIGRHDFYFDGECVFQNDDMGAPSLHVDDLDVDVRKRKRWRLRWETQTLLADVSFVLRQRTLLAIIGPSGSGKSTLLGALTGVAPATKGTPYFNGRDLYQSYSEFRTRIGVVPQEDVLHRQLKLRRALRFAAALRLAWDVPRSRRWRQVDKIMNDLSLAHRAKVRIDALSGGERKRTSVAVELLTRPTLLALDEPTSGLDPHLDRQIMEELALAKDEGRTVIVVTHTPLHLDLCDHVLVMCPGGRIGYFGPPGDLLTFFEAETYTEVFRKVANESEYWPYKFLGSEVYRKHVNEPMTAWKRGPSGPGAEPAAATGPGPDTVANPATGTVTETATAPVAGQAAVRPGRRRRRNRDVRMQDAPLTQRLRPLGALSNLWTLCTRMLAVILSDRGYVLLLLGVPPILALLSHTIPGDKGLSPDPAGFNLEAQRLLVVLVTGAAFMGLTNSVREIVKESQIYRRERAAGLSPTVYLLSKFIVLAVIDCLQAYVFVRLALLGRGAPAAGLVLRPDLEIWAAVAAVAVTSSALGLALGALVRTPDQATAVLVIAVMAQLVLSGALFEITPDTLLARISWVDPSRWGFAAAAATTDLNSQIINDPLWVHEVGRWWLAMGVLALQTVVLLGLGRYFLRRYEPGRLKRGGVTAGA